MAFIEPGEPKNGLAHQPTTDQHGNQRGWWRLETNVDLDAASRDHIADLITEGFTEGEVIVSSGHENGFNPFAHSPYTYHDETGKLRTADRLSSCIRCGGPVWGHADRDESDATILGGYIYSPVTIEHADPDVQHVAATVGPINACADCMTGNLRTRTETIEAANRSWRDRLPPRDDTDTY